MTKTLLGQGHPQTWRDPGACLRFRVHVNNREDTEIRLRERLFLHAPADDLPTGQPAFSFSALSTVDVAQAAVANGVAVSSQPTPAWACDSDQQEFQTYLKRALGIASSEAHFKAGPQGETPGSWRALFVTLLGERFGLHPEPWWGLPQRSIYVDP